MRAREKKCFYHCVVYEEKPQLRSQVLQTLPVDRCARLEAPCLRRAAQGKLVVTKHNQKEGLS